jgi:hypothetical protein
MAASGYASPFRASGGRAADAHLHEVEPVTSGERWSLIVNGYGPPLR